MGSQPDETQLQHSLSPLFQSILIVRMIFAVLWACVAGMPTTHRTEEHFFIQRLDHFESADSRTFKQRYFVNTEFYDHQYHSPLIVYIGGNENLTDSVLSNHQLEAIAQHTSAALFALEHRFFGASHPFSFLNSTSMQFLRVDLALSDIETFISAMRRKYCQNMTCPVLVVGGAYSGSLASWFRLYYPHVANYSWASSAPIAFRGAFTEYDEMVASTLKRYSESCFVNTKLMLSDYHRAVATHDQSEMQRLRDLFELPFDVEPTSILWMIWSALSVAVEYNDVYEKLEWYCQQQENEGQPNEAALVDLYRALIAEGKAIGSLDPLSCVSEDIHDQCAELRSWMWLTCNELGWFPQSAGFMSSWINRTFFDDVCQTMFNITVGDFMRFEDRWGGAEPRSSYVVFTQGTFDPWSGLGISTVDPANAQFLWKIEGASHCSDLNAEKIGDSEELKRVRKMVVDKLSDWLMDKCSQKCTRGKCLHDKCLCDDGWSGEYCTFRVVDARKFWIVGITALLLPLLILISVGGTAWWLFRKIQEEQFLLSLRY